MNTKNATSNTRVTEMPRSDMTGVESMTSGMPDGEMMGGGTVTMAGMATTEMPFGDMLSAERYRSPTTGELPAMEIPGKWRLTLSPASFKSGV